MNKKIKISLLIAAAAAAAVLLLILSANAAVWLLGRPVYFNTGDLPEHEYGLLPGTTRLINGKYINQYFANRIDAAAALYRAGKVRKIIVSGDNSRKDYNETEDMRTELIKNGVKNSDIMVDYAGFRTLDSLLRARSLYNAEKFVIISQKFHCERAIFLGRGSGLQVCGFAAADPGRSYIFKRMLREPLARVLAVWDLLVGRRPKFEK